MANLSPTALVPWITSLGILGCAALCVMLGDFREQAPEAVALACTWAVMASWAAWHCRSVSEFPIPLVAAAIGTRLLLLSLPPTLSDDVFRYLWEGRVQQAGFSPFLFAPSDPTLLGLRDAIHAQVAHPNVSTIYPPLAQWLFRLSAFFYTPLFFQTTAALADLGIVILLARRARSRGTSLWPAVLWALHPLPILESAGSGHLEAIAILATVAAVRLLESGDRVWGALLATLGGLVKLLPFVLVAQALRAPPRRKQAAIAGACALLTVTTALPFLRDGMRLFTGFETFATHWSHNASLFGILEWACSGNGIQARQIGVCIGIGVCVWAWRTRASPAAVLLWTSGALVLLSPVVHPWYVLWPLAGAMLTESWAWGVLASTVLLSYLVLQGYDPNLSAWTKLPWIPWIEYPPFALALFLQHRYAKRSVESSPSTAGSPLPSPTPPGRWTRLAP